MGTFESAVTWVLAHEGSTFVLNDYERGPSKYGVTLKTYSAYYPDATAEDIQNLDPFGASKFYKKAFWDPLHFDLLTSQRVAIKVFDQSAIVYNDAVRFLQRAVGVADDGILGNDTAEAANLAASKDEDMLLSSICREAAKHYALVVQKQPKKAPSLPGWLSRAEWKPPK